MTDSRQLLADYSRNHSETAFHELVARYLNLVYSTAFRLVDGDAHRAEDVTQIVFTDLAKKAHGFTPDVMLGGWLHRHTCFVAANIMRGERRRLVRERHAAEMNLTQQDSGADFSRLAPLLDETINELEEADRTAILLRFFEQQDFRSVGRSLESSEDAARMRVNRALEKLRKLLQRRGITTTATALSVVIAANAVQAAPAGLAVSISAVALAGAGVSTATAAASTTIAAATKAIAMTTLQKTLVTATAVVLAGTGVYEARQVAKLRDQNQTLQQQQVSMAQQIDQLQQERDDARQQLASTFIPATPRLPAPQIQTASLPVEELQTTNLYERVKDDWPAELPLERLETYLDENGRNAASLLAAYRKSGDISLLNEAMEKYPDDPLVTFEAVMRDDLTPELRRAWLDAFERADPDNSLANYLSALDYLKSGQTDQAVQEFMAASGKPFQDFSSQRYQDDTEALLAAGYSVADAKVAAGMQLLLPQLQQMKEVGLNMIELAKSYQQIGDNASAQAVLQWVATMGERYGTPSPGEATISQLVGIHLEAVALKAMDPSSPYGTTGQTVLERLDLLDQQRAAIMARSQQAESIFPQMTDQDWINYRDRWLMFGEQNAIEWLVNKYNP